MKAAEILVEESDIAGGVVRILRQKGYKYLGSGIDQTAFLEPRTGLILKIFGTTDSDDEYDEYGDDEDYDAWGDPIPTKKPKVKPGTPLQLTAPQKSFKAFADYCMKHKNNPFLPNFLGWTTFEFEGKTYLQIRMERLFKFTNHNWAQWLAYMAEAAMEGDSAQEWLQEQHNDLTKYGGMDSMGLDELISHIGREGINQLWKTLKDLSSIADRNDYSLDLHSKNFMLGSDGHIVISDPFHTEGY